MRPTQTVATQPKRHEVFPPEAYKALGLLQSLSPHIAAQIDGGAEPLAARRIRKELATCGHWPETIMAAVALSPDATILSINDTWLESHIDLAPQQQAA